MVLVDGTDASLHEEPRRAGRVPDQGQYTCGTDTPLAPNRSVTGTLRCFRVGGTRLDVC